MTWMYEQDISHGCIILLRSLEEVFGEMIWMIGFESPVSYDYEEKFMRR